MKSTSPIKGSCCTSSSSVGLGKEANGNPRSTSSLSWRNAITKWTIREDGRAKPHRWIPTRDWQRGIISFGKRMVDRWGRWKVRARWMLRWAQPCCAPLGVCPLVGAWSPIRFPWGDNLRRWSRRWTWYGGSGGWWVKGSLGWGGGNLSYRPFQMFVDGSPPHFLDCKK